MERIQTTVSATRPLFCLRQHSGYINVKVKVKDDENIFSPPHQEIGLVQKQQLPATLPPATCMTGLAHMTDQNHRKCNQALVLLAYYVLLPTTIRRSTWHTLPLQLQGSYWCSGQTKHGMEMKRPFTWFTKHRHSAFVVTSKRQWAWCRELCYCWLLMLMLSLVHHQ